MPEYSSTEFSGCVFCLLGRAGEDQDPIGYIVIKLETPWCDFHPNSPNAFRKRNSSDRVISMARHSLSKIAGFLF